MISLRALVGLVASLVLLWVLLRATTLGDLAFSLGRANYLLLAPAILVYFSGVWLRSMRWGMLLRPVAELRPGRLFRATIIGFTVNNLLPLRLGEIARAMLLARWVGVPPAATLGTIVVERLFDGLTLCAMMAVIWLWLPLTGWLRGAALIGALIFLAGTTGAWIAAFWPKLFLAIGDRLSRVLPGGLRERILRLLATFLDGLAVLRQGRVLLLTCVLSTVAWLTEAAMYYLIMLGFGFNAGPLSAILGMVAANLGTMVPSSPGFVGTFDVPLQAVLTELFDVDPHVATSYTLVVHAALLLPVICLGLFFLWREGLTLGDVGRRARGLPNVSRSTDPVGRAL